MKRSRFTEEQIIGVSREQEAGARRLICAGGMGSARRRSTPGRRSTGAWTCRRQDGLKALEDENAKLKKLLADAMLDNVALKDLLAKKF